MPLSSSSTDAEVYASYDDNASFREGGSAAKCRAFITACRILLRRRPSQASLGSRHSVSFDARAMAEQLRQAEQWLAVNGASGGGIRHASFESLRD